MNPCDLKVRYSLCRLADKPLRPKFLIVDCRSVVPENFQRHLISHFPTASVDYAYDSIARPGFDIYFVEADYIEQNTSRELIWNIKRLEKTALVIALSATNDLQRIDQFSRFGFAGFYGTDKPESSLRTRGAVHDHLLATNNFPLGSATALALAASTISLGNPSPPVTIKRPLKHAFNFYRQPFLKPNCNRTEINLNARRFYRDHLPIVLLCNSALPFSYCPRGLSR